MKAASMAFRWPDFQVLAIGLRREVKWSLFNATCAYYWGGCAGLPNDDEALRNICEVTNPADWCRTKGQIFGPHFKLNGDGRWHLAEAKEEYTRATEAAQAASKRGKTAAAARWGDTQTEHEHYTSNAS